MLASEMIVKLQGMILRYGNQPCTDSNGDELDDPEFVPADQDGPAVFVMAMESQMHIEEIERVNLIRKARWHSEMDNWVLSDWSNAMAGEAGEACNVVKKIRRIETGLRPEVDGSMEELRHKLAMEIADVFLYLQLLASEAGINMTRAIVEKFNFTSRKYDFPERLSYEGREL